MNIAAIAATTENTATPSRRAWLRFRRNRAAMRAGYFLIGVAVICAIGSVLALNRFAVADLAHARRPPSFLQWFGTDLLGRSLLARCLLGGMISLGVGLSAAVISVVVGVTWGSIAGWSGGRVDALMMRIVDVLYGLPYLLLVILLKVGLDGVLRRGGMGRGASDMTVLLLAIGGVSWLTMARIVRGQVLSLKTRPFVEAARGLGASPFHIWRRHLLPNLAGPIVIYATLTLPQAILQESFLSFLGIGVLPPLPSWGNLAADGLSAINDVESFWWLLVFPCGLLSATLFALNLVGDGCRDAVDPRGTMPT